MNSTQQFVRPPSRKGTVATPNGHRLQRGPDTLFALHCVKTIIESNQPVSQDIEIDACCYLNALRGTLETVYLHSVVEVINVQVNTDETGRPVYEEQEIWGVEDDPSEWYVVYDRVDAPAEYRVDRPPPPAKRYPVDVNFEPPPGFRRVTIYEVNEGTRLVVDVTEADGWMEQD